MNYKIPIKKIEKISIALHTIKWYLYGASCQRCNDEDFYAIFTYGNLYIRRRNGDLLCSEELLRYEINYGSHYLNATMTAERIMEITKDLFDFTDCEVVDSLDDKSGDRDEREM